MIRVVIFGSLALLCLLLLLALNKPDTFRLQRSLRIHAPAEKIYAHIQDFHEWAKWSPWDKKDMAMQRHIHGAPAGPGAIYEWTGNNEVGQGRMEIKAATAPSHLLIQLDFFKPFEAHNRAEFTLTPLGPDTEVTWSMSGPQPFVAKLMSIFFDMEKMVGPDFEKGLADLKTISE